MIIKNIIRPLIRYKSKQCEPPKMGENMCNDLNDKVAIVTGGVKGIGFECVRALLKAGCKGITIADIDEKGGEAALKKICDEFGNRNAIFLKCDVTKPELLDWAFKNTLCVYDRLDIVVNNAGVLTDQKWETAMRTNMATSLVGCLLGLQYMSKTCKGKGGVIINIGSTLGITPLCGCPVYSMTQSGIIGLTRALGTGCQVDRTSVKIMCLCAGLTNTNLIAKALKNTLNDRFSLELRKELTGKLMQEPCVVGEAVVDMIIDGEAGSVWVVEDGCPPYEIEFPTLEEMRGDIMGGADFKKRAKKCKEVKKFKSEKRKEKKKKEETKKKEDECEEDIKQVF